MVIAPAFVISSRAFPVESIVPEASSTLLSVIVPPVKSITTRTNPVWLPTRIFVAVKAADADAGTAATNTKATSRAMERNGFIRASWQSEPRTGRARAGTIRCVRLRSSGDRAMVS